MIAVECPACGVYKHDELPDDMLHCGMCQTEWKAPANLIRFRHMQPSMGAYGSRGVSNGCEQSIHDSTILAVSEAEAMAYVRYIHGRDHFVVLEDA